MNIEGRNAVTEALKGDVTIEKLYVEKGNFDDARLNLILSKAREKHIKIIFTEKQALEKLSETGRPQGVIAVSTEFNYSTLEEICERKEGKPLLIIILDGVEDPQNLGAIIRVADCVGANGVIIPKHRGSGVTDVAVKVSAGATAYVKVCKVTNTNDAIRKLKEDGIFVFGADMAGESVYKTNLTGDIAVVIGGEGSGVHELTKKLCDGMISLPQLGQVNSLNASVATGAILYECIRQRLNEESK